MGRAGLLPALSEMDKGLNWLIHDVWLHCRTLISLLFTHSSTSRMITNP